MRTSANSKRCRRTKRREDVNRAGKPRPSARKHLATAADLFADMARQGARSARAAAPLPVRPPAPAQRTGASDKPDARPSVGYAPRHVPGRLLMQFAPLSVRLPRMRDPATGRLLARAPGGAGFDRAAAEHSALWGESAQRLAALSTNHGDDHE
jgi:hypothetical protein